MICLLDTNVVSQRKAKHPNPSVLNFLESLRQEESFLSVITLMEVRAGIEKLKVSSGKRKGLEEWLDIDIRRSYTDRILPVTAEIADFAGRLLASEKKAARTPSVADLLIAATAMAYGMTVVTLNRKHFEPLGVPIAGL